MEFFCDFKWSQEFWFVCSKAIVVSVFSYVFEWIAGVPRWPSYNWSLRHLGVHRTHKSLQAGKGAGAGKGRFLNTPSSARSPSVKFSEMNNIIGGWFNHYQSRLAQTHQLEGAVF